MMVMVLTVMIHMSIINHHYRDMEIHHLLETACDYALDSMMDAYSGIPPQQLAAMKEYYTEELLEEFCRSVNEVVTTDGIITVSVLEADIESGTFDILVREDFNYGFMGKRGTCSCECAVTFKK